MALVRAGHPAAAGGEIALAALADEPWVLARARARSGLNARIRTACARAGFEPDVACDAPDLPSVLGLVAGGLGVSVVPRSISTLAVAGVAAVPLGDADAFTLPTALVWRRDDASPLLARLRATQAG